MASRKQTPISHEKLNKRVRLSETKVEDNTKSLCEFVANGGQFDIKQLIPIFRATSVTRMSKLFREVHEEFAKMDGILECTFGSRPAVRAMSQELIQVEQLRLGMDKYNERVKAIEAKVNKEHGDWEKEYLVQKKIGHGEEILYALLESIQQLAHHKEVVELVAKAMEEEE